MKTFHILTAASMLIGLAATAEPDAPLARGDHHRFRFGAAKGTLVLVGEGKAKSKAEYATFRSTVTAMCWDKAGEGKRANDLLANRILDVMKRFQAGEEGKVLATGGTYMRATEYYNAGNETKVLCTNKFRVTNTLTLTTSAMDKLAEIQDALLEVIGNEEVRPTPENPSQTRANLTAPTYTFAGATRKSMRREAQVAALKDVQEQLDNVKSVCELKNVKLQKIEPVGDVVVTPRYAAMKEVAAGSVTPTIPDDLTLVEAFRVVYTHDGCTKN